MEPRFEAATVLSRLRDFQRRTAEYVFRRFYLDEAPTDRFLVADEVGLGKTMVARGVIALAMEYLRERVSRIDVVYVCSNQAIAQQNLNRLNVTGDKDLALPTRMTLLPLEFRGERALDSGKVNFISFTPGTTFDLKSSAGIVKERVLLHHLLRDEVQPTRGLYNLLQAYVSRERWDWDVSRNDFDGLDQAIVDQFKQSVRSDALLNELQQACEAFHRYRETWPEHLALQRSKIIGRLRAKLARASLNALEPDLIILDEFQRFKDLLHGDSEAAELARALFNYADEHGNRARTLLLSATPYRMLTLNHESGDDDHYHDFIETLTFLFGGDGREAAASLSSELRQFRRAMLGLPDTKAEVAVAKGAVEARLRSVMARTERVGATKDRDAMLIEVLSRANVETDDLQAAIALDRLARALDAPDIVEYWKSGPYLLSFMRDYVLKQKLREQANLPNEAVLAAIRDQPLSLKRQDIETYRRLPPANARLRLLQSESLDAGAWRLLWLPPSLPYYAGDGPYANVGQPTKTLVFAAWNLAPDAIAALLSYEAERRMLSEETNSHVYGDYSKRPRLLRFSRDEDGRLTGMPVLTLLYPCVGLAKLVDPLDRAVRQARTLSYEEMRAAVREIIATCVARVATDDERFDGPEDQRWYWAMLAALDSEHADELVAWSTARGEQGWLAVSGEDELFADHVHEFVKIFSSHAALGRKPQDLVDTLVDIALGSPAICALRALPRIAPELAWTDASLLSAAALVAMGFRTLFNQADAVALLRSGRDRVPYWRLALEYGAQGNLQAVLDEYAHVLVEALGVVDHEPQTRVKAVAQAMHDALSTMPAQIDADTVNVKGGRLEIGTLRLRGRFAMRLAEYRDEEGAVARIGRVRDGFNSPFRPFVLATTSIGQEGLDFHPYCRRVCHWNLPSNPVDLEQREGRIHRYKNHSVRLNLAKAHGIASLAQAKWAGQDPWSVLFSLAKAEGSDNSDLVTFWLFEGEAKVERRIPILPYSREVDQLERLKRSLTVYRLAFGQPRQDDLIAFLEKLTASDVDARATSDWQIDLSPDA